MYDDRRRIRFASISGIERTEIPIAAEVWLETISQSCWADRNIVKLATHLLKYLKAPVPSMVEIGSIERSTGLDRRQLDANLRSMAMYGAIENFDCSGKDLRASLNLTYLQRLRVLEIRRSFMELQPAIRQDCMPWHQPEPDWLQETTPLVNDRDAIPDPDPLEAVRVN